MPRRSRITRAMKRTAAGFSLVEMAVVLVIVGLLLGSLMMPLSAQMENQRRETTAAGVAEVGEALLGFAAVYRRLPCPDTDGDGVLDGIEVALGNDPNNALDFPTLPLTLTWLLLTLLASAGAYDAARSRRCFSI